MFIDGDDALPTWCGTGLEDYVGTAWGMGEHQVPLQGVPLSAQSFECSGFRPGLLQESQVLRVLLQMSQFRDV